MKFQKETLLDILFGAEPESEVIEDEISDTSRWSEHHELTFKYKGNIYGTTYSCGATEMQDESPFEYDPDEIECEELEPVEVTVVKYLPVNRSK